MVPFLVSFHFDLTSQNAYGDYILGGRSGQLGSSSLSKHCFFLDVDAHSGVVSACDALPSFGVLWLAEQWVGNLQNVCLQVAVNCFIMYASTYTFTRTNKNGVHCITI